MPMVTLGQFARYLDRETPVVGRGGTIVDAPAVVAALSLFIDAQHIGVAPRHPGRLCRARRRQADHTSRGGQLLKDSIEPLERETLLFGLERNPAKHPDRRDGVMALLHQPDILIQRRTRPLFRVIISPVPDKRRARIHRGKWLYHYAAPLLSILQ